jgi:hypothetical protein
MVQQRDFQAVFEQLKGILKPFEPRLVVEHDLPGNYSLNTHYSEKYKKEVFFGAVHITKSYVSYHLMPVYAFPDLLEEVSPGLRARMQGKSCFNFKTIEPTLYQELSQLTERSFNRFVQLK